MQRYMHGRLFATAFLGPHRRTVREEVVALFLGKEVANTGPRSGEHQIVAAVWPESGYAATLPVCPAISAGARIVPAGPRCWARQECSREMARVSKAFPPAETL